MAFVITFQSILFHIIIFIILAVAMSYYDPNNEDYY